jgi:hypothetical protein
MAIGWVILVALGFRLDWVRDKPELVEVVLLGCGLIAAPIVSYLVEMEMGEGLSEIEVELDLP